MNNELLKTIIDLVVTVVAFLVGRYVLPKVRASIQDASTEFEILLKYAESYCSYARQFLNSPGTEKMDIVVNKLKGIAEQRRINIDDETLKAIAQKAYDAMIAGENAAKVVIGSSVDPLHNISTFKEESATPVKATIDNIYTE